MARFKTHSNTHLNKLTDKEFSRTVVVLPIVLIIFILIAVFNFLNRGNYLFTYPMLGFGLILLFAYKKYLDSQGIKLSRLIKGFRGERNVGIVLTQLPDEYTVYNDLVLDERNGNIDFVVVGPNGVFTIEVKNRDGEITFDGSRLLRNGSPMEKDYLFQANKEYEALHNYLLSQGLNVFVTPILVFNQYAKIKFGRQKVKNVTIIGFSWIIKTITEFEPREQIRTDLVNQAIEKITS